MIKKYKHVWVKFLYPYHVISLIPSVRLNFWKNFHDEKVFFVLFEICFYRFGFPVLYSNKSIDDNLCL